jgi:hypothetical protein
MLNSFGCTLVTVCGEAVLLIQVMLPPDRMVIVAGAKVKLKPSTVMYTTRVAGVGSAVG